jgi:hypothetical protein
VNVKVVPLSMMPSENLKTICLGTDVRVAPAFGLVDTTFECDAKPAETTLAASTKARGENKIRLASACLHLSRSDFTLNFTAKVLFEGESDPA